jgi:hypothetical protein
MDRAIELTGNKNLKPYMITMIINANTRTADVYEFDQFHHHLGWRTSGKAGYRHSVRY